MANKGLLKVLRVPVKGQFLLATECHLWPSLLTIPLIRFFLFLYLRDLQRETVDEIFNGWWSASRVLSATRETPEETERPGKRKRPKSLSGTSRDARSNSVLKYRCISFMPSMFGVSK